MKVSLTLSTKTDANGMSEINLKANKKINGKVITMRAKSEVYVLPVFFSPLVGVDLTKKRVIAPDVRQRHVEAKARLDGILSAVATAETNAAERELTKDWLQDVIDKHMHPDKYMTAAQKERLLTFAELGEVYLRQKQFAYVHTNSFRVLMRDVARYEGFVRATDRKRENFTFNVHTVDRDTLEDFMDYLRNEKELSGQYPKIFECLLNNYPASTGAGRNMISGRGENAVIKLMKRLRAFFHWLNETGRSDNRPFEGVVVGSEKYGTPFYISIGERNTIASTPMPTKHLETQRDIFVFQCFVGCRVGDLVNLTADNIHNGILEYCPHKTKDEGQQSRLARVPLHPKALAMIAKYKGTDTKGRLFPFISPQKYNDAIKQVFTVAGITRDVIVRNALTGESEVRPINEVASSHLARRTFVGNAYKQVQDPNVIGKMSGHVEGSRAFARYRNIEDETLKNVISLIG